MCVCPHFLIPHGRAEQQFLSARQRNVSMWVIGHIPPGGSTSQPQSLSVHKFSAWYQRMMVEFSDVLSFHLYGHSHFNELRLFSVDDEGENSTGVVYVSPAATPWEKQNPSFRIFEMEDEAPFRPLDYHQYYADIENQPTNGDPLPWQHLYSAKQEYNLTDLSPSSWNNLLAKMWSNRTLFQQYYENWKSKCPKGKCNSDECIKHMICAQRHISLKKIYECQFGILNGKRA